MILDGWGIGPHTESNAIWSTPTPYWDSLIANYPNSRLKACGEDVGLPDGQMGNSEVGHLNIGGGRIVYQDLVKINKSIADGSILNNPEIVKAYSYAKQTGKGLHIMGLTSTGGVHSSMDHLFALCDIAKKYELENVYLHCFMDGRDTDPESGKGFIEDVEKHLAKTTGVIATITGRYYAMDRDKRWDRVKLPLAILLASLMTFGNLGEHVELTALKSAGISLVRVMKSLIVFISFRRVCSIHQCNIYILMIHNNMG